MTGDGSSEHDDSALVGSVKLLESPNVSAAPPHINRPIPVPSVFLDGRGEIHNVKVGGKRVNLLYSRQGVMRSGDVHANAQHDFIISGQVELWLLTRYGTEKKLYGAHEYISVPPYVPHLFHFLQDTVMAEWWEPEPFYAWFYHPYRRFIQSTLSVTATPNRLQELVPKEQWNSRYTSAIQWTLVSVALGFLAGRLTGRGGKPMNYPSS